MAKRRKTEDKPQTMEDWLQLTDDYDRRSVTPGKKRVCVLVYQCGKLEKCERDKRI